jgi:LacI family transcriptional regulator
LKRLNKNDIMAENLLLNSKRPSRNATAADVARQAGVSPATVSYVVRGRRDVQLAESTRERVLAAAKDLGYSTNPIASALKTGRTGQIAIWIDSLLTSHNARVVHLMEQQLAQASYQIVVSLMRHAKDGYGSFTALPADGIIAHEQGTQVAELLAAFPDRRLPIVVTGAYNNALEGLDTVSIDLSAGAAEAAEHLVRQGRTRIAYLAPALVWQNASVRIRVYREVLARAGLSSEEIVAHGPMDERNIYRVTIREYIQAHGCPDGLLCLNDDMAMGAYRGLCDLGIRVPDDCALVGCDGIEETEYGYCPLTTIVQPIEQMCAQAWELLARRLQDPEIPVKHQMLQAQLAVRQSSGG